MTNCPNSNNSEMLQSIKLVAPGTVVREGLDNILNARTGALLVFGEDVTHDHLFDGGFHINMEFTANNIYELAKMDGAIVLSQDGKRILYANVHLAPDSSIQTEETGTRHKTAERLAKQTGKLVISISQRRNVITLYKGKDKYVLKETSRVFAKANQALQTLERHRRNYDGSISNLNRLEMDLMGTLNDACISIKRAIMVLKMACEIEDYLVELGTEGNLIRIQMEELTGSIKGELKNIVKDYMKILKEKEVGKIVDSLLAMDDEDIIELSMIAGKLGYPDEIESLDLMVENRGFRILSKIPRLPSSVISNIVRYFGSFKEIVDSTGEMLNQVEGVGIVRARNILEGFRRLKDRK